MTEKKILPQPVHSPRATKAGAEPSARSLKDWGHPALLSQATGWMRSGGLPSQAIVPAPNESTLNKIFNHDGNEKEERLLFLHSFLDIFPLSTYYSLQEGKCLQKSTSTFIYRANI